MIMHGKIIKLIAGLYYVNVPGHGVFECNARGVFRNKNIKPLVGDNVEIALSQSDCSDMTGSIINVFPRNNELIRPAVSNVDQALVVFAVADPKPNFNLIDRFIIMMKKQKVDTIICFSKKDLVTKSEEEELKNIYKDNGCCKGIVFTGSFDEYGNDSEYEKLLKLLEGRTTAFAGPSGVGKSTLLNRIVPGANMETNSVSEKIKRGRHTTRHSEIFHVSGNTYVLDTPGFTSLYLDNFEKEEIKDYFPEFANYSGKCKFLDCMHINEPSCAVKAAVEDGFINNIRYENYKNIYEEVKNRRCRY